MAHNIEIKEGRASFVENGRKSRAWHRLGTVYDRPLTVKEALHGCHADYKVALQPLAVITVTKTLSSGVIFLLSSEIISPIAS